VHCTIQTLFKYGVPIIVEPKLPKYGVCIKSCLDFSKSYNDFAKSSIIDFKSILNDREIRNKWFGSKWFEK